jgi:hypothetical protein
LNPFSFELLYWNWQSLAAVKHLWQIQSVNQVALFKNTTQWSFIYNGVTLSSNHNYTEQVWHHLVCTYDGANMHLYVDGQAAGPSAAGAQAGASVIMEISTNLGLTTFGGGFYSEVAYYTSALSQTRVSAHFAAVDNVNAVPRVAASGGGGVVVPPYGADIASILASVRKTY